MRCFLGGNSRFVRGLRHGGGLGFQGLVLGGLSCLLISLVLISLDLISFGLSGGLGAFGLGKPCVFDRLGLFRRYPCLFGGLRFGSRLGLFRCKPRFLLRGGFGPFGGGDAGGLGRQLVALGLRQF